MLRSIVDVSDKVKTRSQHIKLTSHAGAGSARPIPVQWGAAAPRARGAIIATLTNLDHRNVIGPHPGSYAVYRALAVAAKALDPQHVPDLTNAAPTDPVGPYPVTKPEGRGLGE